MIPFRMILVLFFALPAPALAQCQCIDVGDIKARMKEAEAAMKAMLLMKKLDLAALKKAAGRG